jgi:hypothetical protein
MFRTICDNWLWAVELTLANTLFRRFLNAFFPTSHNLNHNENKTHYYSTFTELKYIFLFISLYYNPHI